MDPNRNQASTQDSSVDKTIKQVVLRPKYSRFDQHMAKIEQKAPLAEPEDFDCELPPTNNENNALKVPSRLPTSQSSTPLSIPRHRLHTNESHDSGMYNSQTSLHDAEYLRQERFSVSPSNRYLESFASKERSFQSRQYLGAPNRQSSRPVSANCEHHAMFYLSGSPSMYGGSSEVFRNSNSSLFTSLGLTCYGFKPTHTRDKLPYGRGYCLIIADFTDYLQGYEKDTAYLKEFFENELHYEVEVHKNLCQRDMLKVTHQTSQKLATGVYDRFFMFVLSHGCEKGIYTCVQNPMPQADDDIYIEETIGHSGTARPTSGNDIPLITEYERLVEFFQHTNLPQMSNFPKVFIFQSCRGGRPAKAAGNTQKETASCSSMLQVNNHQFGNHDFSAPVLQKKFCSENNLCRSSPFKVTEGADIMMFHSCTEGTQSWVPDTGSAFVEEILKSFKKHYDTEHLADIMVAVNQQISRREIGKRQWQMSEIKNRLTKKFYLKIPQRYLQACVEEIAGEFHFHDDDS